MYEKVNPMHPDKVADRIAGAMIDLAYSKQENPKCAIEVLIGHGKCQIINETSCHLTKKEVKSIVNRIADAKVKVNYLEVKQDIYLSKNQSKEFRCGDNGVFKGVPTTREQKELTRIASEIYGSFPTDGKYILDGKYLIVCQSNCKELYPPESKRINSFTFNPLGYWTGGINVDSGATNRKLGSDMGDAVTGGGLCGKDLSKADVSVNIYCHLLAQENNCKVLASCAIGDTEVKITVGKITSYVTYDAIVKKAKEYIDSLGGFEKFAEWGLIR